MKKHAKTVKTVRYEPDRVVFMTVVVAVLALLLFAGVGTLGS